MQAAHAVVSRGFKDAGYMYINQDDCWQQIQGRDSSTHQLLPNYTKYPDGIEGTAAKVHDLGLKFGIYSSAGTKTCGGYPASLGYEQIDATTFAAWGVDYLKVRHGYPSAYAFSRTDCCSQYDNCNVPLEWLDNCLSCNADPTFDSKGVVNGSCTKTTPETEYYSYNKTVPFCALNWPTDGLDYSQKYTPLRYRIMQNALLAQNRTILYSLCEWGVDLPWTWANETASSWRISNDIFRKLSLDPYPLTLLTIDSFMGAHSSDNQSQFFSI